MVWPLIPRKTGRGWELNAALGAVQEHFTAKPVNKNTAQSPAEVDAHSPWKANMASAECLGSEVVHGAAAGEQDRDLCHHLKLGTSYLWKEMRS